MEPYVICVQYKVQGSNLYPQYRLQAAFAYILQLKSIYRLQDYMCYPSFMVELTV